MRETGFAVLLACILVFGAAATGHAVDRFSGLEQQPGSQTLRYIYDAGHGIMFIIHIHGKDITISSSFSRPSDNYRIFYTTTEGDKQLLQLAEGPVMTIEGDRLLWGQAVYIQDHNPAYYYRTVKYQYVN